MNGRREEKRREEDKERKDKVAGSTKEKRRG